MNREEFFKIVPARQFFTKYCPQIKRFYHKLEKRDGNGKPLDFTVEEKKMMEEGVKRLANHINNVKF